MNTHMWVPKVQVSSLARSKGAISSTGCTMPSEEPSMSSANSEPESVLARADRRPDRLPTLLNQGGALSAGVQHESAMPETGS